MINAIARSSLVWSSKKTTNLSQTYASNAHESTIAEKQPNKETPLLAVFRQLKMDYMSYLIQVPQYDVLAHAKGKKESKLTQFFARVNHKVPMIVQAKRKG